LNTEAMKELAPIPANADLAAIDRALTELTERFSDAALKELAERHANVVYDVATKEGLEEATAARRELRGLRVSVDKRRQEINKPLLAKHKEVNARATEIVDKLTALEDPIDNQIKAEETRKEELRQAKVREERIEAARVQRVLDDLRNWPVSLVGKSADTIQAAIVDLRGKEFGDLPESAADEAVRIRDAAVDRLVSMHAERVRADVEAADLARERAEFQREREEDERQRRERDEKEKTEREERERVAHESAQAHAKAMESIDTMRRVPLVMQNASLAEVHKFQERLRNVASTIQDFPEALRETGESVRVETLGWLTTQAKILIERAATHERAQREAAEERQRAIDTVSLVDAAQEAADWLTTMGHGESLTVIKLRAAIARSAPPVARRETTKRKAAKKAAKRR
jgi:hypothetical protein